MEVVAYGGFIHFQSREYFAPAGFGCCGDVEVVEEEKEEEEAGEEYCPFHSDHEMEIRIAVDNLDRRRWERERERVALREEEERRKRKGKYFKGLVKGIVFAA